MLKRIVRRKERPKYIVCRHDSYCLLEDAADKRNCLHRQTQKNCLWRRIFHPPQKNNGPSQTTSGSVPNVQLLSIANLINAAH